MSKFDCRLVPNSEFVGNVENADNERQAKSAMRDAYRNYKNGYRSHGQSGQATVTIENLNDSVTIECREI